MHPYTTVQWALCLIRDSHNAPVHYSNVADITQLRVKERFDTNTQNGITDVLSSSWLDDRPGSRPSRRISHSVINIGSRCPGDKTDLVLDLLGLWLTWFSTPRCVTDLVLDLLGLSPDVHVLLVLALQCVLQSTHWVLPSKHDHTIAWYISIV